MRDIVGSLRVVIGVIPPEAVGQFLGLATIRYVYNEIPGLQLGHGVCTNQSRLIAAVLLIVPSPLCEHQELLAGHRQHGLRLSLIHLHFVGFWRRGRGRGRPRRHVRTRHHLGGHLSALVPEVHRGRGEGGDEEDAEADDRPAVLGNIITRMWQSVDSAQTVEAFATAMMLNRRTVKRWQVVSSIIAVVVVMNSSLVLYGNVSTSPGNSPATGNATHAIWRYHNVIFSPARARQVVPYPVPVGLAVHLVPHVRVHVALTRAGLIVEELRPDAVGGGDRETLTSAFVVFFKNQLSELFSHFSSNHLGLELHVDLFPGSLCRHAGDPADGFAGAEAFAAVDEHEVGLLVADEADKQLILHAGEGHLDGRAGQLAGMRDLDALDDLLLHGVLASHVADLHGGDSQSGGAGVRLEGGRLVSGGGGDDSRQFRVSGQLREAREDEDEQEEDVVEGADGEGVLDRRRAHHSGR